MTSEVLGAILAQLKRCEERFFSGAVAFRSYNLTDPAKFPGARTIQLEARTVHNFRRQFLLLEGFAAIVCGKKPAELTEGDLFFFTLNLYEEARKAEQLERAARATHEP